MRPTKPTPLTLHQRVHDGEIAHDRGHLCAGRAV